MLLQEILQSDGVMRHRVKVSDVPDRLPWIVGCCQNKSVLHVGCCDVPVFDPNNNLHIELSHSTDRIDGLDISKDGIEVLKRHVYCDYFTSTDQIEKEYDLVLAPEVLEHTENAHSFLADLFRVQAKRYLITAPDIQWYAQTRRVGDRFIEEVHSDHRAWYSPYTLLNTVRPFVDEKEDELEIFLIQKLGSVAIQVEKKREISHWIRTPPGAANDQDSPLNRARALVDSDRLAEALYVLRQARRDDDSPELYSLQAETLLALGRQMDAFRASVAFMRDHPRDTRCMLHAANAAEGLGQLEQASELRAMAAHVA